MNSTEPKRKYSSSIREAHLEHTRQAILRALSDLLSKEGLQELSIRKLSHYSGISIRTIYRHFPNKTALLDAVAAWVQQTITGPNFEYANPRTPEDLIQRMIFKFGRYDANPELVRAQIFSQAGRSVREHGAAARKRMFEQCLNDAFGNADPRTKKELVALCYFLMSADAWQHFRDIWKFDASTSSKLSAWTIDLILMAAIMGNTPVRRGLQGLEKNK